MSKVLVLGSTGMLGSSVVKVLEQSAFDVTEANRSGIAISAKSEVIKLQINNLLTLKDILIRDNYQYVINCVGLIRQLIQDALPSSVLGALRINSEFPIELERLSREFNFKIIQIGTDCVFSGERGQYLESDRHSPIDVYGMTKSLGEVVGPNVMTLRCSIIGPELNSNNSLFSWLVSQPNNSNIKGYINHFWNGLTSFHFSKIVSGIIRDNIFFAGKFHLLPADYVTKKQLLELIAKYNKRLDLKISEFEAPVSVNRTLDTIRPDINEDLWRSAGYNKPPNVEDMVSELSEWVLVN